MSGFTHNGVDLDNVFEPIPSGTGEQYKSKTYTNVGFRHLGKDLRDYYVALEYGTRAAISDFSVGGVDLRDVFAAKGSVVYTLELHVTSNHKNFNLKSWADGQIGSTDYSNWRDVRIFVDAGVTLGTVSTGVFPIPLTIINNGNIYGAGGNAGNGAYAPYMGYPSGTYYSPGSDGSDGGHALILNMAISLENNGKIYGGGGGGAGGVATSTYTSDQGGDGGGGGQGYDGGAGGAAGGFFPSPNT